MSEKEKKPDGPMKDLVDRFLRAYRLDGKMEEMNIINNWEEIIGKAIANRTKSVRIHEKVLYIDMNSSVMRDELQQSKSLLMLRVNEYAGKEIVMNVWLG
jgi:predicted nucleic acid-binding Zn ribbon protein